MPWDPSPAWKEAYFAAESDKIALLLATVDHPDLASPLRFALNGQPLVGGPGGETFENRMFEVALPSQKRGEIGTGLFLVEDVDRVVIAAVGELVKPPTVRLQIVRWDAPATVEQQWLPLLWTRVSWTEEHVEGSLDGPPALRQRRPAHSYTPGIAPGLFRI